MILFDDYTTSIWCVIITMTTVGYGDVVAVSHYGRIISIINALWGAFIISMLVAFIGTVFALSESQKKALAEITNYRKAGSSIRASIQYYNAKRSYEKTLEQPDYKVNDYIPSKREVNLLKKAMETEVEKFQEERKHNKDMLPDIDENTKGIEVIKD